MSCLCSPTRSTLARPVGRSRRGPKGRPSAPSPVRSRNGGKHLYHFRSIGCRRSPAWSPSSLPPFTLLTSASAAYRAFCASRTDRRTDGRTDADGRYSRYARPLAAVRKKVRHLFSLPLSLRSVRLALSLSLSLSLSPPPLRGLNECGAVQCLEARERVIEREMKRRHPVLQCSQKEFASLRKLL